MVEMAKANDLNTYTYLTYLLSQRPNDKMSEEELEQLAPWSELRKLTAKTERVKRLHIVLMQALFVVNVAIFCAYV